MMLKHTNNNLLLIFITYKEYKMIISTILKSKYKNYRKYRFEMIIDAYISAITGKLGFNESIVHKLIYVGDIYENSA